MSRDAGALSTQEVVLVRIKVQKQKSDNRQLGYSENSASVELETFQEEHLLTESEVTPRNIQGALVPVWLRVLSLSSVPLGQGQRRTQLHIQGRSSADLSETSSVRTL